MRKIDVLVKKPAALLTVLVLLGVTTHASSILLFSNLEDFRAATGATQLTFNFDGFDDTGFINAHNFAGLLTVTGDFAIQRGAINFAGGSGATMNFASNIFAFGGQFDTLGKAGLINFAIGGLRGASFGADVGPSGFVGFVTDFPFHAFNINFRPFDGSPSPGFAVDNLIATAVPEPSTLILLIAGAGLAALARRKKVADRPEDPGHVGGPSDQI